jgi:hypothetical protein
LEGCQIAELIEANSAGNFYLLAAKPVRREKMVRFVPKRQPQYDFGNPLREFSDRYKLHKEYTEISEVQKCRMLDAYSVLTLC